jgi:hypothetical protein
MRTTNTRAVPADWVHRFVDVDDLICPRCGHMSLKPVPPSLAPLTTRVRQFSCDHCHAAVATFD